MYISIEEISADWNKKIHEHDFNSALNIPIDIVNSIIRERKYDTVLMGSKFLDDLCVKTGEVALKNIFLNETTERRTKNLIIATHVENVGGHSQVIRDLAKGFGDDTVVLVTNLLNVLDEDNKPEVLLGISSLIADKELSPWNKLLWCQEKVRSLNPDNIILVNHHQDAIAIASIVAASRNSRKYFYHHADFSFCLGIYLDNVFHLDPHNLGFFNCRNNLLIRDNLYIPLTAPSEGKCFRNPDEFGRAQLKTCTSGSAMKFEDSYLYTYEKVIAKTIKISGGIHYHIGHLSDRTIENLKSEMLRQGVDFERWIHIEWVPSIWQFLIDNKIDVYINSFPWGGARATIEAMGAGIPVLNHESYLTRNHCGADIVYPEAMIWRSPEDIENILCNIDSSILKQQSHFSRLHFERYHSEVKLKEGMETVFDLQRSVICPEIRPYQPDHLTKFLHDRYFKQDILDKLNTVELSLSRSIEEHNVLKAYVDSIETKWISPKMGRKISQLLNVFKVKS